MEKQVQRIEQILALRVVWYERVAILREYAKNHRSECFRWDGDVLFVGVDDYSPPAEFSPDHDEPRSDYELDTLGGSIELWKARQLSQPPAGEDVAQDGFSGPEGRLCTALDFAIVLADGDRELAERYRKEWYNSGIMGELEATGKIGNAAAFTPEQLVAWYLHKGHCHEREARGLLKSLKMIATENSAECKKRQLADILNG